MTPQQLVRWPWVSHITFLNSCFSNSKNEAIIALAYLKGLVPYKSAFINIYYTLELC